MVSRRQFLNTVASFLQLPASADAQVSGAALAEQFRNPPPGYGPVPFWWWTGEPLDKERLLWQIEQLHAKGVAGMNVSYNHDSNGETDAGEPLLFSDEWWDIWRTAVAECKRRGMSLGFEDYTLTWPDRGLLTREILREHPELRGHQLSSVVTRAGAGETPRLEIPEAANIVSLAAYPLKGRALDQSAAVDLSARWIGRKLDWRVPAGEFTVVAVLRTPDGIDAMHPDIGARVIEKYWTAFERETPGEMGKAANYFFQDELMFGKGMPYWSEVFAGEFRKRKGYNLLPWLPALWHDMGPKTPKVRLDYADVAVSLMEEHYFRPIFEWAQKRGMIYGHDQAARGDVVQGSRHYGDYFRAMRWYTAPGNDDPGPSDRRPINRTKVSSSIAHLYERKRTWLEAYHSSGWGITPERLIAYLNQNYCLGTTLLNLHGLYYTTYGTWWEWAPPDFHFRQPFWKHMDAFSGYVSRLSYLLSQGSHRCDVAIVYPVAPVEAGMGGEEAEKAAFGLGEHLFRRAVDFDYIDHQSLERAEVRYRELRVSGEAYRVLVLAGMRAVRQSTLEKAVEFQRAGGAVLLYGAVPEANDTVGLDDPGLRAVVAELKSVAGDAAAASTWIEKTIQRDFVPSPEDIYVLHRVIGETDVYMVNNPRNQAVEVDAFFRTTGRAEVWDPWTGSVKAAEGSRVDSGGMRVPLSLAAGEAQLVVFHRNEPSVDRARLQTRRVIGVVDLDGAWDFSLEPTMDNRFGDFRLPPTPALLGPEARRFRYAEETSPDPGWQDPSFDDSGWEEITYSFGPRLWTLGPFAPGTDVSKLEGQLRLQEQIDPAVPVEAAGQRASWKPYRFSLRWGIERDPQLLDKMTGPHGLKKKVPDDFIDLGVEAPGSLWYVFLAANDPAGVTAFLFAGSKAQYQIWLNGKDVVTQPASEPVLVRGPWRLPDYTLPERTAPVRLQRGLNRILMKLVHPDVKQRLRAYAVLHRHVDAVPSHGLALRWFTSANTLVPDLTPWRPTPPTWFRFVSPPGLVSMSIQARGRLRVWTNGREAAVDRETVRVTVPSPEPVVVALRIEPEQGCRAGCAIPEPIALECTTGRTALGDWCGQGLAAYSGAARYGRSFSLPQPSPGARVFIDLGKAMASAEVFVNGRSGGIRLAPPWRLDITDLVQQGENRVEIVVANTLANHYSVGTPTPYVFPGQTVSGLLGPVRIETVRT